MIASLGFQCFPSGMTFNKPITLTMPHCADLLDPAMCKLILYLVQDEDGLQKPSITRKYLSPETCRVRKCYVDLALTHFTWGFITWVRDSMWIKGINMLCMPYLPQQMPMGGGAELEVCLYKHIKGCAPRESTGSNISVRACLRKAEEFTIQSEGEIPLTVNYQIGDSSEVLDSEVLTYRDISQIIENKSGLS